jgi:uncharacterized protein (TIGR02246 family)
VKTTARRMAVILMGALFQVVVVPTALGSEREADVRACVETFEKGWNSHDMDIMFQAFTPDADWINIVGMWWRGKTDVRRAHQAYHETFFKQTPYHIEAMQVRFITADTAIAVVKWRKGAFRAPDGRDWPEGRDFMSLFLVKQKGRWLITHGHNTTLDEDAQLQNPIR